MISEKTLYQIALTQIKGVGVTHARSLMQALGDEEAIFKGNIRNLEAIPGITNRLINEIRSTEVLKRAEKEIHFIEKNRIQPLFFTTEEYPSRLANCIDAPVLLYSKGNIDFNKEKVISIVGTRKATEYGRDFCDRFIRKIAEQFPDVVIISGLAYGIDIWAHRAALKYGLTTVGVLGHGLDRIYPAVHRQTAIEILGNGGLLTEFPSDTNPDRHNFVKRNRIVAGISDATIVIESDIKGGSLITAEIANSYFRDVFALPGRITDKSSLGCNHLISDNKAILLNSETDFIEYMGWTPQNKKTQPLQKELFVDLNEEESKIVSVLSKLESIHVNTLSIELNIPVSELFFTLLELEMKNLVKTLPGGLYKLI